MQYVRRSGSRSSWRIFLVTRVLPWAVFVMLVLKVLQRGSSKTKISILTAGTEVSHEELVRAEANISSQNISSIPYPLLRILYDHRVFLSPAALKSIQAKVAHQREQPPYHVVQGHKSQSKTPSYSPYEAIILLWHRANWDSEFYPDNMASTKASRFKGCLHTNCRYTNDRKLLPVSRMVVLSQPPGEPGPMTVPPITKGSQVQAFMSQASPHWADAKALAAAKSVSYSISYKADSDVVITLDEAKWTRDVYPSQGLPASAFDRPGMAYQIVDDCRREWDPSSLRRYNARLQELLKVDVYGKCLGRPGGCEKSQKQQGGETAAANDITRCPALMRRYLFYFAFEDSFCREHITEKFWRAIAMHNIPVVMGPPRADYDRVAPPGSYIHAGDFGSAAHLAQYLRKVSYDRKLFMSYHLWRYTDWQPRNPTQYHHCEMCRLANERPEQTLNGTSFWSKESDCTSSPVS